MTAQPQDHQSATFTHTFASGESVTLPRFKKAMTFGRARRLRKLSAEEQMFTLIEEIADDDTLAVLDDLDAEESNAFIEAWQDDSDVTSGESSA